MLFLLLKVGIIVLLFLIIKIIIIMFSWYKKFLNTKEKSITQNLIPKNTFFFFLHLGVHSFRPFSRHLFLEKHDSFNIYLLCMSITRVRLHILFCNLLFSPKDRSIKNKQILRGGGESALFWFLGETGKQQD